MDLKPCPFCGNEEIRIKDFHELENEALHGEFFAGYCGVCGTVGPRRWDDRKWAADRWNLRKISNVQYAEVLVEWMKDSEFKEEYNL